MGKKLVSRYPKPPRELAGKWVAWSRYRIVASGNTLAEIVDQIEREGIKGASYERLPILSRRHTHGPKDEATATNSKEMAITITVSPETDAQIDNLAEAIGGTKGDAILRGLALLKIALDAKREGRRLLIVDDETEQEVTDFWERYDP